MNSDCLLGGKVRCNLRRSFKNMFVFIAINVRFWPFPTNFNSFVALQICGFFILIFYYHIFELFVVTGKFANFCHLHARNIIREGYTVL